MSTEFICLVISLETAVERRTQIANSLRQLGISFEFVNGIDARITDITSHPDVDATKPCRTSKRLLVPGELACALGHVMAYRRLLASEAKYALVLEDDAILQPDLIDFLRHRLYTKFPLVMLGHNWADVRRFSGKRLFAHYRAWRAVNMPGTTVGYMFDRPTAERLIACNSPVHNVADWPMDTRQLNLSVISPPLVLHPFFTLETSLIGQRPPTTYPGQFRNRKLRDYFTPSYWKGKWYRKTTRRIS